MTAKRFGKAVHHGSWKDCHPGHMFLALALMGLSVVFGTKLFIVGFVMELNGCFALAHASRASAGFHPAMWWLCVTASLLVNGLFMVLSLSDGLKWPDGLVLLAITTLAGMQLEFLWRTRPSRTLHTDFRIQA